jgi:hypothetical protein
MVGPTQETQCRDGPVRIGTATIKQHHKTISFEVSLPVFPPARAGKSRIRLVQPMRRPVFGEP